MNKDIDIKKVVSFYYGERVKVWKRDVSCPRIFDGIVFFTEGSIEYHFEDRNITAEKGDILLLPGNLPYKGRALADKISYYVLNFSSGEENEFQLFAAPAVVKALDYEMERKRFEAALLQWNRQLVDVQLRTKIFTYSVLCQVLESQDSIKSNEATDRIIEYITQNLSDERLNVLTLCEKFYISQSQLRRNIYRATNLNPNEYILSLRLNKAQNELIYTDKSIKQISGECGFSSPYYFSNCFSKRFQMSPVKFRRVFLDSK